MVGNREETFKLFEVKGAEKAGILRQHREGKYATATSADILRALEKYMISHRGEATSVKYAIGSKVERELDIHQRVLVKVLRHDAPYDEKGMVAGVPKGHRLLIMTPNANTWVTVDVAHSEAERDGINIRRFSPATLLNGAILIVGKAHDTDPNAWNEKDVKVFIASDDTHG